MSDIDASIALQGKPVQLDNPLNALAQAYQVRALGNQNSLFPLQQQEMQLKLGQQQRMNDVVNSIMSRWNGGGQTAPSGNALLPQTPAAGTPGQPGVTGPQPTAPGSNPSGIPTDDGIPYSLQDLGMLAAVGYPGAKEMLAVKQAAMQGAKFDPGATYQVGGHVFTVPQLDPGTRVNSSGVVEAIPGYSSTHAGIAGDTTTATVQATNDNTLAPLDRIDPTTGRPYAATVGGLVRAVSGGQPGGSAPAGASAPGAAPAGFQSADQKYGFPPGAMQALAMTESSMNPKAVSKKGAQGLFQVMPATQQQPGYGLGRIDPNDPMSSGGYLAAMVKLGGGDFYKGLAKWNAGPGGDPNNPETQGFLSRFKQNLASLGGGQQVAGNGAVTPVAMQTGAQPSPAVLAQLQSQVDAVKSSQDPNAKATFMQQMLPKIYSLPPAQRAQAIQVFLADMSSPAGTPIQPLSGNAPPVQVAANPGFSGTGPVGFHGFAGPADLEASKLSATKQVQAHYDSQQKFRDAEFANMADYSKSLNSQLSEAQALLQRIGQSRAALQQFQAGGGAEMRADAAKIAQALHAPDGLVNALAGGDLSALQQFQKYSAQEALQTMQQSLANDTGKGSTGNRISMQLFIKNNPNIDTDPHAIEKIFNFQTQLHNQLLAESNAFQKYKSQPGADVTQFPNYWANQMIHRGYVQPQMVTGQAIGTHPAGAPAGPSRVNNDADYAKLPSGALFTAPDGSTRRKP